LSAGCWLAVGVAKVISALGPGSLRSFLILLDILFLISRSASLSLSPFFGSEPSYHYKSDKDLFSFDFDLDIAG